MKPILKPPGTKHLKLQCDIVLSTFAFKSNMHHYILVKRNTMLTKEIHAWVDKHDNDKENKEKAGPTLNPKP